MGAPLGATPSITYSALARTTSRGGGSTSALATVASFVEELGATATGQSLSAPGDEQQPHDQSKQTHDSYNGMHKRPDVSSTFRDGAPRLRESHRVRRFVVSESPPPAA